MPTAIEVRRGGFGLSLIWQWNGVDTTQFTRVDGTDVVAGSSGLSVASLGGWNRLRITCTEVNPLVTGTIPAASVLALINGTFPANHMVVARTGHVSGGRGRGLAVRCASLSSGYLIHNANAGAVSESIAIKEISASETIATLSSAATFSNNDYVQLMLGCYGQELFAGQGETDTRASFYDATKTTGSPALFATGNATGSGNTSVKDFWDIRVYEVLRG